MELNEIIEGLEDLLRDILVDRSVLVKAIKNCFKAGKSLEEQYIKYCKQITALKGALRILNTIRRLKNK